MNAVCREKWSEVLSSEMAISAESVSYLDSEDLMQLRSDASIGHICVFGMIQLCPVLIMTEDGHHSTLYALRPFLGGEPCLAI